MFDITPYHDRSAVMDALRQAWCRETSADPDGWSEHNPAHGQCAVSVAILAPFFDLPVQRGEAILPDGATVSHYRFTDWDPTLEQFPEGTRFRLKPGPQGRDALAHIMSHDETVERLCLLKGRFLLAYEPRARSFDPAGEAS